MCVPTSSRVSRESISRQESRPALGLGQPVAHLLEPPGQAGIVEGEADVILDDPQSLARAIGRGVEDPRQVHAPAGLGQVQRGDSVGHRERPGVHGGGPRQAVAQRLELQAGGAEQLRDGVGRGHQTGQQMLGADLARSIQPAGLAHRLAQDQPQGRRPAATARAADAPASRFDRFRPRPASPWPPAAGPSTRRTPASSSAARLSASSASAASRSSGSTSVAPRRRATGRPASRARSAPAVNDSNISIDDSVMPRSRDPAPTRRRRSRRPRITPARSPSP